ncbi:MAG: VOC family protein [Cyclobacteriaceae bacterium]|jgi:catechol 2,3-dioxygenase-like lactoylglutathione lyase family enzyme|nr:VOC family protein [Cyclobacteriaceae bacterium]
MKTLHGIDTVIIRVSDYQRAKTWYEEKLNLNPVFEDPKLKLVVMDTGSPVSLTLWQTEEPIVINRATSAYPIFRSHDAREAHRELTGRGVRTGDLITDHQTTWFCLYDPDGNMIEVCQVHA